MFKPGYKGDCLALIAGALLPFAFAPFGLSLLSVIAPALLLITWLSVSPKTAAKRGFLFGLGAFGVGTSWIYVSIHTYGNTPVPVALFITSLFVVILASYPAAQGYVLNRLFPGSSSAKLLLAFPASFALFEWLRSWLLSGFPWLILGFSQIDSPLHGFIPLLGEFGTSFFVLLSSGLLVHALLAGKKAWYKSIACLLILWLAAAGLGTLTWTHPRKQLLNVSIVQGNIPQNLKWEPSNLEHTLQSYLTLTESQWGSRLIIWPEAAIPLELDQARPFIAKLEQMAKRSDSTLFTGVPVQIAGTDNYYNALLAVGKEPGIYYKRHLVPFGEYLPFSYWLKGLIGFFDIPMSDFVSGPLRQEDLLVNNTPVAPFICYEIAYPAIVRQGLPRAELLITVTNNAWFGNSFAPWQQLEIGRFRALQTGRYLLSSSNDGISAIVNARGDIEKSVPQFCQCVLTGQVRMMTGETPWVMIGTTPIILSLFLLLGFAWLLHPKRRATNTRAAHH
jgi:apolipoprotein N-acyltransferase